MPFLKTLTLSPAEQQRVRALIENNTRINPNGCRLWIAGMGPGGYGMLWTGERSLLTHVAVKALEGPILVGKIIRHLCHVKLCCQDDHLKVGTSKENGEDDSKLHHDLNRAKYEAAAKLMDAGYCFAAAARELRLPESPLTKRRINEARR